MVMAPPPLRIAFLGTPEFAVPTLKALLNSRHELVAVVSQPDRPKGRGQKLQPTPTKAAAIAGGVQVLQPAKIRDEAFLAAFGELRLDLAVVAAYGKILPDSLLQIPRLGMINVHASLLPQYRGAAPVHRAVIDGRAETGVTIMRVVRELDAGPMLAKVSRVIGAEETSVDVEAGLASLGATLLVEVVEQLAAGSAVEEPQDDSLATYANKITRHEGVIDWQQSAETIHNRVRGLQPWPLVSVHLDGQRYLLHRTRPTGNRAAGAPGTILEAAGDRLIAAAGGDGESLQILQLQPEGRRVMSAREFLAGRRIQPGMQFVP
jgi:methionyl-tRNA formyltransferase